MKVFGISDLHLDTKKEKPMDIFGSQWIDHEDKIFEHWKEVVGKQDIVLIPGDISWAMNLKDAKEDLEKIEACNGIKVITKGNHDYWWSSLTKMNALSMESINFIHNNCFCLENQLVVYGTRGWIRHQSAEKQEQDEYLIQRELQRLKRSYLASLNCKGYKVAMLHYSPFAHDGSLNVFGQAICQYEPDLCVYGHLHGDEGHRFIKEGIYEKTRFVCLSADYLNFQLKEIILL